MRNYRSEHIRSVIAKRNLLQPLDILIIGATGAGKSSTINAIFGNAVTKVGDGVDPETQYVSSYTVHDYLRIYDSAGLGDGLDADKRHSIAIAEILNAKCTSLDETYGLIDLVLVILDGASRDLGTTYQLLESVVLNRITADRVVVAINQADMGLKGRSWNHQLCIPERELIVFLDEKARSIQRRIRESLGLVINTPICYSALNNWNVDQLVDHIIYHIPYTRRSI